MFRFFLPPNAGLAMLVLLLSLAGRPLVAQDNVTIPKSRLEELERKEKELEQLKGESNSNKGDLNNSAKENLPQKPESETKQESRKTVLPTPATPAAAPVATIVSPPFASLAAFQPYETVESMDLANYYHTDPNGADHRFHKQKLTVRGEIVGFEKPLYKSNYRIVLKTLAGQAKVICDFLPPDNWNAVFTTNHGDELVARAGAGRVPIAKVGQTALIKGECKGRSESAILILARELNFAP